VTHIRFPASSLIRTGPGDSVLRRGITFVTVGVSTRVLLFYHELRWYKAALEIATCGARDSQRFFFQIPNAWPRILSVYCRRIGVVQEELSMRRTMVQEFRMQRSPMLSAKGRKQAPANFCCECKRVGPRRKYKPGSFQMEVGLWFLFLVPGIIYLLWRLSASLPVLNDFGRMLATQLPGVVRILRALLSPYRTEPYGPDIENWVFFFVPGIFYSFWRLWAGYEGCAKCGSRRIVSMDSPYAQAYLATLTPRGSSQPWVCGKCASQVFLGGRVCPNCGAELQNQHSNVAKH